MNYKQLLFILSISSFFYAGFSQNIGIGENNPASKLSVKGNLSIGTTYSTFSAPTNGAIIEGNIGIGTYSPDASAQLDITATNKGFLFPRVALTATNVASPIASPANSLTVFNTATAGVGTTAVSPGIYYWDGTKWVRLISNDNDIQDLSLSGNILSLTNDATSVNLSPYLDNTDMQTLSYDAITGVLDISNGNSIIIPVIIDTDDQTLSYDNLTGDLSISDGNTINIGNQNDWHITGNNGISNVNFLGTLNNASLRFKTNNIASGEINPNGFVALGAYSGLNNTSSSSVFLGGNAGKSNTLGVQNIAIGTDALTNNTIAADNIAIGQAAATANLVASKNIAIGTDALSVQSFSNGGSVFNTNNIAIGYQSLKSNQPTNVANGINNIAVGSNSLDANTTGSRNIAIGTDALGANISGLANIAIGRDALLSNTINSQNTAIGIEALKFVVGGTNNTAIGYQAAGNGNVGSNNTIVGANAAYNNTGSDNVVVGHNALITNTSGVQNVAIGKEAGQSASGAGNIFIGYQAGYNETGSNKLYIENSNSTSPLIGGNFATNKIAINAAPANHTLYVNGGPIYTSNSWAGSVELNSTAAIAWRSNASSKTFGMGYTDNGFYLFNSVSSLASNSSAAEYRMIVHDNGGIAIGANLGSAYTPSAPLHVDGFINGGIGSFAYYSYNGAVNTGTSSGITDVSIYASNRIRAAEFNAFSDARIKKIIGVSTAEKDLSILSQIEVTDYQHIDVIGKGDASKKGFIAQQIEKVFPEAVSKSIDFIPNIYEMASSVKKDPVNHTIIIYLNKEHQLVTGDMVKLITDKTYEESVTVIDDKTFSIKATINDIDRIFVYGKSVNDFRAVDYDRIFTLNVSATQVLLKRVEALEKENAHLKQDKAKTEASIQNLIERVSKLEEIKM